MKVPGEGVSYYILIAWELLAV